MRFAAIPAAGRAALPVLLLLVASPSTPQSARARADESVAQGASLFARGDLKGARESYLQAIAVAPGHFSALHRLARVESELSQGARARRAAAWSPPRSNTPGRRSRRSRTAPQDTSSWRWRSAGRP